MRSADIYSRPACPPGCHQVACSVYGHEAIFSTVEAGQRRPLTEIRDYQAVRGEYARIVRSSLTVSSVDTPEGIDPDAFSSIGSRALLVHAARRSEYGVPATSVLPCGTCKQPYCDCVFDLVKLAQESEIE